MIIVQNTNKDVVGYGTTLTKAMDFIGMSRKKYEYLRSKIRKNNQPVEYGGFIFSRW